MMLLHVSFNPDLQSRIPLTLGSLETLGILKEAMVDMLTMRGCGAVIEVLFLIYRNGRRLLNAIDHPKRFMEEE
jgi:hypothetical protein